jgi:DNA-binding CsgD family transcriptional regulator
MGRKVCSEREDRMVSGTSGFPVRGRDEELVLIESRLDETQSGVGSVIIVEGKAGSGKTRLLEACASIAAARSFRVGRGEADPGRTVVELDALFDALFGGEKPLAPRDALSDTRSSPEQRFWLLQDIQALIEEAALRNPLLICLDDLQWAGDGCAVAMRQLPRRLASLPVAWVMAFRPNQGLPQVQGAKHQLEGAGATMIRLGPLGRDAAAEIAFDVLGAPPDDKLLSQVERAQGNPFLLVELFRGLQDEGIVTIESGKATLLEERVPRRVSDDMRGRLLRMSPVADRVATLASALGRRFSLADLAEMTGMPITDLLEPVKELIQADIFAENDSRLGFGHDLIREAVRSSSSAPVRRALDRQAADVLLSRGALPVEVAQQLGDSAEPGDEVAIDTLLQAADALGSSDPAASAELAGRALELAPPWHSLRGPLVARRAVSLFAAGQVDEAKRFADTALRQALPSEEEARVRLAVAGMFNVSPDIRADNVRAALALPDLSPDTRALLWGSLFHNVVAAVRPEEALSLLPKARDAVHASRERVGWFALEVARSALQYQLSYFEDAPQILAAAERRTVRNHEDARRRLAAEFMASDLAALDRIDETFRLADEGLASAQRDRQNWALRMFETLKGRQLLQTGRLAEAAAGLEGVYSVADADRVVGMLEAPNVVALGKLRIHTEDDTGAAEVADMAKIMLRASAPGVQNHAAWFLAVHAMSQGKPVEAHDCLCAGGCANRLKLFPLFPFEIADDPQLVRIAVAVGDQELADVVIEQAERRCELNPDVVSLRAGLAHARGLAQRSTTALEAAASLFGEGCRPLATASALEDLGRLLAENGVADEATTALDQAFEIWVQVGASWDARRVHGRLRRLGVRRRVVASKRPRTGWEALTSAEAAVAQLASEGKTNREIGESLFISPHTVNTHLRHIFDKLGVKSRVALTRAAEARHHQSRG